MKVILQLKLLILILFISIPYAAGAPKADGPVEIVGVRTGLHKDFHRLVIELSGKAGFTVLNRDGKIGVRMPGVALKFPLDMGISTDIIKFMGVTTERTCDEGPIATLNVSLERGFMVNQLTREEPFRIILDFSRRAESARVIEDYDRKLEALEGGSPPKVKKAKIDRPKAVKTKANVDTAAVAASPEPPKAQEVVEEESAPHESVPDVVEPEPKLAEEPSPEELSLEEQREELVKVGKGTEGTEGKFADPVVVSPPEGIPISGVADNFVVYKLLADKLAAEKRAEKRAAEEKAAQAAAKVADENLPEVSEAEEAAAEKMAVEKKRLLAAKLASERFAAEKAAAARAEKALGAAPAPKVEGFSSLVLNYEGLNFNDAWRWEYRKEIIIMLKDDLESLNTIEADTLKAPLGLLSEGTEPLAIEADALAKALKKMGKVGDAAVLDAIVQVFKKDGGRVALEVALRRNPSASLKRLGWFFIARRLEAVGLYPEALGYYSRIEALGEQAAVRPSATFSKARLNFIMGAYEDAKVGFEKSVSDGFKGSDRWLANTLFIKGETRKALELYKTLPEVSPEDINPIMLMGIGDIKVAAKDYTGALEDYERLQRRYGDTELLGAYFMIKKGDVYRARGEVASAVELYTLVRDTYEGTEARAVAMLSLAGVLAHSGESASVIEAEEIYRQIARGDSIGAVFADLNMVSTEAALGSYETALTSLDRFKFKYTTHPLRKYASSLKGEILHNWLVELYKASDHYGIAKAVARHGTNVPFGKKAETYLRVGHAYKALGLYPDAVRALGISAKIGGRRIAEEAMLALGRTHLAARNHGSAELVARNFLRRFPKSRQRGEISRMLADVAYMKGDYKAYVDFGTKSGYENLKMARSLEKLKRYKEALKVYKKVAYALKDTKDIEGFKNAYIGAADTSFMLSRYTGAIGYYKMLLKLIEKDGNGDTSWALFRITQSYSKLKKRDEQLEALKAIKEVDDTFGRSAEPLFGGRVGNL